MSCTKSRRSFLQSLAACSAAFGVPAIVPASALGRGERPAPSERIVMGSIGVFEVARFFGNLG